MAQQHFYRFYLDEESMKTLFAFCFSAIVSAHVVDAIVGGGTLIHEYARIFVRVCLCAIERLDICRTA